MGLKSRYCGECGAVLTEGSRFCGECGTGTSDSQNQQQETSKPASHAKFDSSAKQKKWWPDSPIARIRRLSIVFVLLMLLLMVIGGGSMVFASIGPLLVLVIVGWTIWIIKKSAIKAYKDDE